LIFDKGLTRLTLTEELPTEGMLRGIFISYYNSEIGVAGYASGMLDVTLKLVDDHHFSPRQIQGEMMEKTQLQDCSIL